MYDYSNLLSLLSLCTGLLSFSILFVMITYWLQSNSTREFFVRMNRLENEWIVLQWISKLVRPFVSRYEPKVPSNRIVRIANCTVYLAQVPHKLSHIRLNRETLCLVDLYYHENRIIQRLTPFGPSMSVAISEEAYLQTQLLMQSKIDLYVAFSKAINEYLENIRFTPDVRQAYSPTSEYIYFSQVN